MRVEQLLEQICNQSVFLLFGTIFVMNLTNCWKLNDTADGNVIQNVTNERFN